MTNVALSIGQSIYISTSQKIIYMYTLFCEVDISLDRPMKYIWIKPIIAENKKDDKPQVYLIVLS